MLEMARPGGDMYRPALPELVLYQDIQGGCRTRGDSGGGHFDVKSQKGDLYLDVPNFANTINVAAHHRIRSLSFPTAQWEAVLDEAADGGCSLDSLQLYRGPFRSAAIQSSLRNLWALSDEEGAPSRLLARAAGCEILAELCRLSGASLAPAKGGLAPWARRRCLELMRERLSEDISLDELAAEAQLSPFHFARMFKQSVGVPPRVYLTQLRLERACDLLELTELPITEIASEVGYASNQILARVFSKHKHMSPSDYRRAVRDPSRYAT
ncbi:AraC family transcriptional regulator [Bosea sp. Root381]|uniref:helix-turn-helix domain-containing protein n=1 Tax=Bosea sp. Root381 TaxID=1736524 RepID=UPI000B194711|nr:AraC family transcriptional regulator [Bosea sp. Root381]